MMKYLTFILLMYCLNSLGQLSIGKNSLKKDYYSIKGPVKTISTFYDNKHYTDDNNLVAKFTYSKEGYLTDIYIPSKDFDGFSLDIQEDFMKSTLMDQFYPEMDNPYTLFGVRRNIYVTPNGSHEPNRYFITSGTEISYQYDENYNISSIQIRHRNRNYKKYEIKYFYNSSGHLDKKELYENNLTSNADNSQLIEMTKYEWTAGFLSKIKYYEKDGSLYKLIEFTENNSNGSIISNVSGPTTRTTKRRINSQGKIISFDYYNYFKGLQECANNYECYSYEYKYSSGFLTTISKTVKNSRENKVSKFELIRNENGDILRIVEILPKNEMKYKEKVWEYKYDQMGNWVEKLLYEDLKNDLPVKRLLQKFTRKISYYDNTLITEDFKNNISEKKSNLLTGNNSELETTPNISIDKMNKFFIGVDNPVSFSFPNNSGRFSTSITNGNLIGVIGPTNNKIVRVGSVGKCTITIFDKLLNKSSLFEYRAVRVPEPIFKIGSGKINMPTVEFKSQQFCRAELENFDFDVRFNVVSAKVKFTSKGFDEELLTEFTGNSLSALQPIIQKCLPGTVVMFYDITVIGPDGERKIKPVNYYLY
jgi:hypothetical protein